MDTYVSTTPKTDVDVSLSEIIHAAHKRKYGLAIWRKPGEKEINLIIDLSDETACLHPEIDRIGPGFLVSPFLNESNLISYLVRADIHYTSLETPGFRIHRISDAADHQKKERFLHEVEASPSESAGKGYIPTEKIKGKEADGNTFKEMVKAGIHSIQKGEMIKVVPSRRTTIKLSPDFDLADTYLSLEKAYPFSFVSLFSIPGKGTWLGASPELLIDIDADGIFTTSAVAGTQPYVPDTPLSGVGWTQKEIEEQALVSRYIINCFKKIRLREFEERGPRTTRAGNLVHLRTDFKVDMQAVHFPQLGSVMLKLLHPTSAVCGMPRDTALDFIHRFEGYDREFYSGYLGPVNMNGITSLFVNLRCAKLGADKAWLYAGAGVTVDSDPEKEWIETEIKNQTLRKLLD